MVGVVVCIVSEDNIKQTNKQSENRKCVCERERRIQSPPPKTHWNQTKPSRAAGTKQYTYSCFFLCLSRSFPTIIIHLPFHKVDPSMLTNPVDWIFVSILVPCLLLLFLLLLLENILNHSLDE